MPLQTIYLTRHALRAPFTLDALSGTYSTPTPTPTGIPTDVPLVSAGHAQAAELAAHLATLSPPITHIYSSPYIRCLQTLSPLVSLLRSDPNSSLGVHRDPGAHHDVPPDGVHHDARLGIRLGGVRVEPGLGEWFGRAPFAHPDPPNPASAAVRSLFPRSFVDEAYTAKCAPDGRGESVEELHDRVAETLERIVEEVDAEGDGDGDAEGLDGDGDGVKGDKAVLVCTHAAALIAAGRVLTGRDIPAEDEDVDVDVDVGGGQGEGDFKAYTAGLSVFVRRGKMEGGNGEGGEEEEDGLEEEEEEEEEKGSGRRRKRVQWKGGRGIKGGWVCVRNGDCSFLKGGMQRGWKSKKYCILKRDRRFSGDEDFPGVVDVASKNLEIVSTGRGSTSTSAADYDDLDEAASDGKTGNCCRRKGSREGKTSNGGDRLEQQVPMLLQQRKEDGGARRSRL
ncbi:MAG: hypothetical protein M1816_003955 [Peltula sp. TS41687]|nr:MAG: hypothetical protein M1816_003955 [Peltula sp. TS41687]